MTMSYDYSRHQSCLWDVEEGDDISIYVGDIYNFFFWGGEGINETYDEISNRLYRAGYVINYLCLEHGLL